ncbi:MAG: fibronectin type III domain-containing protein [Candidatus Blackburnbacteria bacterium]|nr:fibronectin type III domain-containing protein [Candidatus Blackburnbacteria bacterium]
MNKKKILGILSFLVLLGGLPVAVFLALNRQDIRSSASLEEQPKEIKVTNISDNSFSVSWLTDKQTSGFIVYGDTDKLGLTAADDRDKSGQTPRNTHHVTVENLNPQTLYYFKIGSGSSAYDNSGSPFSITTAPSTSDPPAVAEPAFGKVVNQAGSPVPDALVYLTVQGGSPLSSYTRSDGNWLITLNNARIADLSTYIVYKSIGNAVDFYAQAGTAGTARATADTNNVRPMPNVMLGGTYSFGTQGSIAQVTSTPPAQTAASDFSLQNIKQASESAIPLSVLVPGKGETVNTDQPTFSGTGKPGDVITITIHSSQIVTAQVTVGQDGKWSYTPDQSLATGQHTVTVASGNTQDTSTFSVLGVPIPTKSSTKTATAPATPVAGVSSPIWFIFLGAASILALGILLAVKLE